MTCGHAEEQPNDNECRITSWLNTVMKEMFICALRLLLIAQNIRRIIMWYVLTRQINALCYRVDKVDVYFGVDTGDDKI